MYVMTSPILYLVAVLTGIVISKYKSDKDIQHLEDYNSKLSLAQEMILKYEDDNRHLIENQSQMNYKMHF